MALPRRVARAGEGPVPRRRRSGPARPAGNPAGRRPFTGVAGDGHPGVLAMSGQAWMDARPLDIGRAREPSTGGDRRGAAPYAGGGPGARRCVPRDTHGGEAPQRGGPRRPAADLRPASAPIRVLGYRDGLEGGSQGMGPTIPARRALLAAVLAAAGLAPGPAGAQSPRADRRRAAAPGRPRPVVVLDPGHGGRDPGTIGVAGTLEKRIVLAAAQEMRRRLEAGGQCRVVMTRTRDVFVPLAGRVEMARRAGAALFVSIHADSAPGARGASVYTLSETASDALSAALARRENAADAAGGLHLPPVPPEVQRILLSLVRQETRQGSARLAGLAVGALRPRVALLPNTHRQAAFAVLKAPDIPSMLVEIGFLSDAGDESRLNRADHRAVVASALAGAVEGYLERPGLGMG